MLPDYQELKTLCPNVSRETLDKLVEYISLLTKWNKSINLISRRTLSQNIFKRHILDSLSIISFIPNKDLKIIDVGSGAGFPGIVLGILGYQICLVEINIKKVVFLKEIVNNLKLLNVKVIQEDIKKLNNKHDIKPDIITSRAFSTIKNIIEWTAGIKSADTKYILLKSHKQYEEEIKAAETKWSFKLKAYENKYSNEGVIIELKDVVLK